MHIEYIIFSAVHHCDSLDAYHIVAAFLHDESLDVWFYMLIV